MTKTMCDRCGKEIRKEPKRYYKLYRVVEYTYDGRHSIDQCFPDLCKGCSKELDDIISKWVKEAKR